MATSFHDVKIRDMHRCIQLLKLLSPFSAIASLFAQSLAVLTNEWLYTEELMPNPRFQKINMSTSAEFLSKYTFSGLWILCQNELGDQLMTCSNIDYFSGEEYHPDPNDSTLAIPYAAKKAAYFMVLSSGITLLASFICLTSKLCNCKKIFTFLSGVLFILSGLFILSCIVVYISTFKAEVGVKLRPKSLLQDPIFKYSYGSSFTFAVASLLLTKLTGTFLVFLYIRQHQISWKMQFKKALDPFSDLIHPQTLSRFDIVPEPIANYCKKHGSRNRRASQGAISRDPSPIMIPKSFRTPSFVGAMQSEANDEQLRRSIDLTINRADGGDNDNVLAHISFISGKMVSQQNSFNMGDESRFFNRQFLQQPVDEHVYRKIYSTDYGNIQRQSACDYGEADDLDDDDSNDDDYNHDSRPKTTPV